MLVRERESDRRHGLMSGAPPVYMASGRMRVVMDDGTEGEAGPGDVVAIAPAHDAEIIGVETCIFLDFSGFESYAKEG